MTRIFTILGFMICLTVAASAQPYDLAIGLRSGPYSNITLKKSLSRGVMTEGILSLRPRGVVATGLLEYHNPIPGKEEIWWYYGFGGHLGAWQGLRTGSSDVLGGAYSIGVDAIVGAEYNFDQLPFNVAIDWKPSIGLLANSNNRTGGINFSIRYRL